MFLQLKSIGKFEQLGGFCVDCYYMLQKENKGGELIFDRSSAKPVFIDHPEIRIIQLPNCTPDKLKGWCFFSWYSVEDSFKC